MSEVDTTGAHVPAPAEREPARRDRPPGAAGDAGGSPPAGLSAAKLALREARLRGLQRAAPLAPAAPAEGGVPLSFAQERLWFLERLQPGTARYVIPFVLRLSGALHREALERALGAIVARHDTLRTTFAEVDGAPVQRVAPFAGFALPVEDLSVLEPAGREAEVRRRVEDDAERPFDLAAGPLFRAALLRVDAEDHVLLLALHHAVGDGVSLEVFLRELWSLYGAFRAGRPSPLAPPAAQYADFAVWQREQLRGPALLRALAYWKERLAGAPALLELPTDHPRPASPSFRGGAVPVRVPPPVLDRLRALERGEGATLFMVVLAAFQLLLSRYAGTDDTVVGTPVAGRPRREVEGLIGLFVDTLVLRTDLAGDPTFRGLVRRVREGTLADFAHGDVPFERLVAEVRPARSLSHAPIFQVMFQLGAREPEAAALQGLRVTPLEAERCAAKFDLELDLTAGPGGLTGMLEYAAELFEPATARRMAEHLGRLLEQAAAHPDRRISALELMGAAERARVVGEWNRTDAPQPADARIHAQFEAQVERTPDAVALSFEDASLTYDGLNRRANRLAHHLVRLGVGPEVRVGLCLERGLEMGVAVLAVLKAGGAYVPLDPAYPAERLAFMLADSAVPVLLVQARLRGALPPHAARVLAVDDGEAGLAAERAENPAAAGTPEGLAYVIYTSGSTGRPKGVMNTHRGVVNRLAWMQGEFGIGPGDVVLQKTPFSFDVSVWELFWPLRQGAHLVMARPDGHRDPAYLREMIERRGVTTLHFVPSMLQPFVEAADAGRCPSLARVVCSGEALSAELARRFRERFPPSVSLHNLYGPTEAAVDVSAWTCGGAEPSGTVPIGRPVWNTRLYVLDAALRPVPIGVPGELCIGGVQVARGYLGRPGLTAERFVPDPLGPVAGARLYRTGDRARWRDDGVLEFLGRLDAQVKVRGFRVEPGEVEAALRGHPAVRDCAVAARGDAPDDRRLAAYVVPAAPVDAPALLAYLRARLPEHMVPSAVVLLDSLPLSPSGKVDRGRLPAPQYAPAEPYAAPATPVEERLAEIWASLLEVKRVGRHDGFFELGGHSLLMVRLAARLHEALGREVPVVDLFRFATVARLAEHLEGDGGGGGAPRPGPGSERAALRRQLIGGAP